MQNDHREWPLSLAYLKEMYVCRYNFFCPFFILERRRSANTNWHIRCEVFMELSKAADLSWVRGAQLSSLYYYYYVKYRIPTTNYYYYACIFFKIYMEKNMNDVFIKWIFVWILGLYLIIMYNTPPPRTERLLLLLYLPTCIVYEMFGHTLLYYYKDYKKNLYYMLCKKWW